MKDCWRDVKNGETADSFCEPLDGFENVSNSAQRAKTYCDDKGYCDNKDTRTSVFEKRLQH